MIQGRHGKSAVTSGLHLTEQQINDFVDGLVRAEERRWIDHHVVQCQTCSQEISRLGEFLAASRADAEMVVAPLFLRPLVLAATIHERLMRRWMVRAMRRPIIVGAIAVAGVSSTLTGWFLLACPDDRARTTMR